MEVRTWLFLNSGPGAPALNMAWDEALLEAVRRLGAPVLRFYGWKERAATFGYFQKYAEVERATLLRPLIRRPTGGGIVPHDADWTYSLVFPPGHAWYLLKAADSYCHVHEWIQSAFSQLNIETTLAARRLQSAIANRQSPIANRQSAMPSECFAGYEKSDLLWHGRKIAGAAQRRNQSGLLIQGSVQPGSVLNSGARLYEPQHIPMQSKPLRVTDPRSENKSGHYLQPPPLALERQAWEDAMREAAREQFQIEWRELSPDEPLLARAGELARRKYTQTAYNRKR